VPKVLTPNTAGAFRPVKVGARPTTIDVLIYGPPKLGKTTLALTSQDVPEMGRYLHIAVEPGAETIRDTYPDTDILYLAIDEDGHRVPRDKQWERFQDIVLWLMVPGHGYGTVAIDTVDELQTLNITHILATSEAVLSGKQDPNVPSPRDYGVSLREMSTVIRLLQDLLMNTIFIAHSKSTQDERTKRWHKKPALVGQLQDAIGGMVNNLVYLTMYPATTNSPPQRVLITAADGEIQAGTRSRLVNGMAEILDPTMAKLWYPLTGVEPAA
jgi:hypothetical protein